MQPIAIIHDGKIVGVLLNERSVYRSPKGHITHSSTLPDGYTRVTVADTETLPADYGLATDAIRDGFHDVEWDAANSQAIRKFKWRSRTLEDAKNAATIEANTYEQEAREIGLAYTLPAGSTLNGVSADGQTVTLDYEPMPGRTETDWLKYGVKMTRRAPRATEEFDVQEGRVTIPGTELIALLQMHAEASSTAETTRNQLLFAIRTAADKATCDQIVALIEAKRASR